MHATSLNCFSRFNLNDESQKIINHIKFWKAVLWFSKFNQRVTFALNYHLGKESEPSFREIPDLHLLVIPLCLISSSITQTLWIEMESLSLFFFFLQEPNKIKSHLYTGACSLGLFVCFAVNELMPFPEEAHMSCVENWWYCGRIRVIHLHYVDSCAHKSWLICLEKKGKDKGIGAVSEAFVWKLKRSTKKC